MHFFVNISKKLFEKIRPSGFQGPIKDLLRDSTVNLYIRALPKK